MTVDRVGGGRNLGFYLDEGRTNANHGDEHQLDTDEKELSRGQAWRGEMMRTAVLRVFTSGKGWELERTF